MWSVFGSNILISFQRSAFYGFCIPLFPCKPSIPVIVPYNYPTFILKFDPILSICALIYPKTEPTTMIQPVRDTESNCTILSSTRHGSRIQIYIVSLLSLVSFPLTALLLVLDMTRDMSLNSLLFNSIFTI